MGLQTVFSSLAFRLLLLLLLVVVVVVLSLVCMLMRLLYVMLLTVFMLLLWLRLLVQIRHTSVCQTVFAIASGTGPHTVLCLFP